jgi:hypothetical protein
VLGRLSSRAFATLAGLRQTDAPARPVLNLLGMALLLMVAADLLENSLHLTLLWANGALWSPLEATLTILLSAAAVAKFAGFAGCVALIGWGAVVRVARSASLEKK